MASLKKWLDRRRNPWKGVFYDAFAQFRAEKGTDRLSDLSFLKDGDVVLDFGGFHGEWTALALSFAHVTSHIFEPHPAFFDRLQRRFAEMSNVHVHNFALAAEDGQMFLSDAGDASSSVNSAERSLAAPVVSVDRFFADTGLDEVALAKINIEGGEYDLLPALADAGLMPRIARLHVQFHLFAPEFVARREAVREALQRTHDCIWQYPFVWEEWQRRD